MLVPLCYLYSIIVEDQKREVQTVKAKFRKRENLTTLGVVCCVSAITSAAIHCTERTEVVEPWHANA